MNNRAQARGDWTIIIYVMIAAIIILIGGIVMGQVQQQMGTPEGRDELCAEKFDAPNATYVNDSDDSFDCRLPSGRVVKNVTVVLRG